MKLLFSAVAATLAAGSRAQPPALKAIIEKLEEIQATNKKDGAADKKHFAELKCWYNDQSETMGNRIKENEKNIPLMQAAIDKKLAVNGQTSLRLAELAEELEQIAQSVKKADAMQKKRTEEFDQNETDLEESLAAMKDAIKLLSDIGADQTAGADQSNKNFMGGSADGRPDLSLLASDKVAHQINMALLSAKALVSHADRRELTSFIQGVGGSTPYSAASGKIIGILKNMKDTFETNLADARETYKKATAAYDSFIGQQNKAQKAAEEAVGKNEKRLAEGIEFVNNKRKELATKQIQYEEDQAALAEATTMFKKREEVYQQQSQLRMEEGIAIQTALGVLQGDDAFDTFAAVDKANSETPVAFLQIRKHRALSNRGQMVKKLFHVARTTKSSKLAKLASLLAKSMSKTGAMPFAALFAEMDKMVKTIEQEQKNDEKLLEDCAVLEFDKDEGIHKAEETIRKAEEDVEKWNGEVDMQNQNIDEQNEIINTAQTEMKSQKESRAQQYADWQNEIKDTSDGVGLLAKASQVLKNFYAKLDANQPDQVEHQKKVGTVGGLSEEASEQRDYDNAGRSKSGSKVITLLGDLEKEYKTSMQAALEEESQAQEQFNIAVDQFQQEIKTATDSITQSEEDIAGLKEDIVGHEGVGGTIPTNKEVKKSWDDKWSAKESQCTWIRTHEKQRVADQLAQIDAIKNVQTILEETPLHQNAAENARDAENGQCATKCEGGNDTAECLACKDNVSVKMFCAGNAGVKGC